MPFKRMHDLYSRYKSFHDLNQYTEKEKFEFALSGFYLSDACSKEFVTTCFYCDKKLSYWEEGDKPFNEHAKRHGNCSLMKLNNNINREKTFLDSKIPKNEISQYVKDGFFFYPFNKNTFEIFCYKCGFFLNINDKNHNKKYSYHKENCGSGKRLKLSSYDDFIKNKNEYFFLKLISGEYLSDVLRCFKMEKSNFTEYQILNLKLLLSKRTKGDPFESTKSALEKCINKISRRASIHMKSDQEQINLLLKNISEQK